MNNNKDMEKLFGLAMAVKSAMAEEGLSTGQEVTVETILVSMTVADERGNDPEGFHRDLRRFCKALLKVRLETIDDATATVRYPGKERLQ